MQYVYRDEKLIKYLSRSTWRQATAWTPEPKRQDNIKTAPSSTVIRLWMAKFFKSFADYSHFLNISLRRRSAAAPFLRLRLRIPLRARMFVSFVCCVVSGLCDKLVIRSHESYQLCVSNCGRFRNHNNEAALAHIGLLCHRKKVWCMTVKTKLWMAMFPATLTLVVYRQNV
jgi:hypothetical protein